MDQTAAKKRKDLQCVAKSGKKTKFNSKDEELNVKPTGKGIDADATVLKPKNDKVKKDVTQKALKRQHNDTESENVVSCSTKTSKKQDNIVTTKANGNAKKMKKKLKHSEAKNVDSGEAEAPKKKKKAKLNNGSAKTTEGDASENAVDDNTQKSSADAAKPGSHINKAIFLVFKALQNQKINQKHLNTLSNLLINETDVAKRNATCAYALKRLIRCTGADDKEAVALNASYMNGILRTVPGIDLLELLQNMKRDLPVGNQLKGKEESLASVGQVITAYSIIETQHLAAAKSELLVAIYQILLAQLRGREYLITMTAQIIINSLSQVSVAAFRSFVWPVLEPNLTKLVGAQKLYGIDMLLAVHFKYPSVLSRPRLLEMIWGKKSPQYEKLFDLYLANLPDQNDGIYERLAKLLLSDQEPLLKWRQHVNTIPLKQYAVKSCVIKVATYILLNCAQLEESLLIKLFSDAFIRMFLAEMQALKQKRVAAKATQQQMRKTCSGFETALLLSCEKVMKSNDTKMAILRAFVNIDPLWDVATQTPRFTQQFISKLDVDGIKQVYKMYLDMFIAKNTESMPKTTKSLRMHCLNQMQFILQHGKLDEERQKQSKWFKKELEFMMLAGLFHLDDNQQICTAAEAAAYSKETASRCEEIFFNCILHKANNMLMLCKLLRTYTQTLAKQLAASDAASKLRVPRTEGSGKSWKSVVKLLQSPCKDDADLLGMAFEALLLFLGLTLHIRTSLPAALLSDIMICQQSSAAEQAGAVEPNMVISGGPGEELSWQDVLTDALLELLVQSGYFWRQFVYSIAAVMFKYLKACNLEQMLQTLDMSKNPLGDQDAMDGESDDEEDSDDSESATDNDDVDHAEQDEEDDDQETRLAQVRENVRLALTNDGDDDDGASSIDWNDVDEEEGQRLNAALERAFQAFKPKQRHPKQQQETKSERISSTTLIHFRARVLELVELFVSQQPSMEHVLDAICTVFQLFKFCSSDAKQSALRDTSMKLLKKLLALKIDYNTADRQPLISAIEYFMSPADAEQKQSEEERKNNHAIVAEWRNKCVAYFVSQFRKSDTSIWPLLEGYMQDWVHKRTCSHMLATFEAIFKTNWKGIPKLAVCFASQLQLSTPASIRTQRRLQINRFLLKHRSQIKAALSNSKKCVVKYDAHIADYATQLMLQADGSMSRELQSVAALLPHGGEQCAIVHQRLMEAKKST